MSEPFDPFCYADEQDLTSKAATDVTSKATNIRKDHSWALHYEDEQAQISSHEAPLWRSGSTTSNRRLPPRLTVKLSHHEEVASSLVEGQEKEELFITGKIMVRFQRAVPMFVYEISNEIVSTMKAQVESTDSNQNAPFRLTISGPMSSIANVKCYDYCTPLMNQSTTNDPSTSYEVSIPKSILEPRHIATYTIDKAQTQNMPILLQTKVTIFNNTCRIGIQIRSNMSNIGDLHDYIIVLSLPTMLKMHTVTITRGSNGGLDEMKGIVSWKIGHLGHGKSNLVSVEAEMESVLIDMVNSMGVEHVEETMDFPVLVRCSSGVDQISDINLSCGALKGVPASVAVQIVKSFRLIHRVCKGDA